MDTKRAQARPIAFEVTREDDCIWFRDYREGSVIEIHLDPTQAFYIARELLRLIKAK